MTDAVNEQLSACLDGELPPAELDLLLKRLDRDGELRAAAGRYTLIGEALRDARPTLASRDFAAKVMSAVASEPAVQAGRRGAGHWIPRISPVVARRLRPLAGIGVAATVAALAVFSVQQRTGVEPTTVAVNDSTPTASVSVSQSQIDPSYVVPTNTSPVAFVPATRLTNYVVAHSEYSSPLARRSVLTGVLAEDDADPDVATSQEPQKERRQEDRQTDPKAAGEPAAPPQSQ